MKTDLRSATQADGQSPRAEDLQRVIEQELYEWRRTVELLRRGNVPYLEMRANGMEHCIYRLSAILASSSSEKDTRPDRHRYGCERDGEDLTEPCDVCSSSLPRGAQDETREEQEP